MRESSELVQYSFVLQRAVATRTLAERHASDGPSASVGHDFNRYFHPSSSHLVYKLTNSQPWTSPQLSAVASPQLLN